MARGVLVLIRGEIRLVHGTGFTDPGQNIILVRCVRDELCHLFRIMIPTSPLRGGQAAKRSVIDGCKSMGTRNTSFGLVVRRFPPGIELQAGQGDMPGALKFHPIGDPVGRRKEQRDRVIA